MERTILIVEDYEDARLCMKIIVEGYGFEVLEAADGFQAVETVKQQYPDLILMDISMPIMDGLTATKAIRKSKHGSGIPILAVTAHGTRLYEKAIKAGCNGLIEKPVDFDSLQGVLDQYLEQTL